MLSWTIRRRSGRAALARRADGAEQDRAHRHIQIGGRGNDHARYSRRAPAGSAQTCRHALRSRARPIATLPVALISGMPG